MKMTRKIQKIYMVPGGDIKKEEILNRDLLKQIYVTLRLILGALVGTLISIK